MGNILQTLTEVLQSGLAGEPPPPPILQTIAGRLNELTSVSLDPSGAGIDRWLRALHAITGDQRLHDTLIVRTLQMRFPRVAEALTALGLIGFEWAADNTPAAFSLNWAVLDTLLKDPGGNALNLLLSKVQKVKDVKAIQALALLYVSGPRALLALEYQRQGFAALPVAGDPGISLQELIDLVNSPLFLALPIIDLPLELADFMALAAQNAPANSSYAALDGPGVGPAGNDDPANGLEGMALDLFI
jgi:hypothetical protein